MERAPVAIGADQGAGARHESLRALRELLTALETDVAGHYAERGAGQVRPRFTAAMIALSHAGPMTVRQLAEQVGVTHSAMSQSVGHLRRGGLVSSTAGPDARTQVVTLTGQGREVAPFLAGAQRAATGAWEDLEAELAYPLQRVVADLRAALTRRSFAHRLRDHEHQSEDHDAAAGQTSPR